MNHLKAQSSQQSNTNVYKKTKNCTSDFGIGKKRTPFFEIINQEDEQFVPYKMPKQSTIKMFERQIIPKSEKKQGQINPSKSSKNQSALNQKNFIQGKKSLQLISIVQERLQKDSSQSMQNSSKFRFIINQEAIAQIINMNQVNRIHSTAKKQGVSRLQQSFSFLTIVGKTKTGKSFLLNQIINSDMKQSSNQKFSSDKTQAQAAFSISHTLSSSTKGIWITKQTLLVQENELQRNVFFLDTQGFGSHDSTQEIDYKLLTLSVLLSDVLCYNSIGPIDEHMINGMSVAVQISNLVKNVNKPIFQAQSQKKSTIIKIPSLIWVLRDFSLQLITKENRSITADQYLEQCLSLQNKNRKASKILESKKNIRSGIKQVFKSRQCSALVLPFDQQGNLRSEFKQNIVEIKQKLKKSIFHSSDKQSSIWGNTIQDFICKLRAYVECLNQNSGQNNGSNQKYVFPRIESLEANLNRVRLLNELKNFNQTCSIIFQRCEQLIANFSISSQIKQDYQSKIELITINVEKQIIDLNNSFMARVKSLLNLAVNPCKDQNSEKYDNLELNLSFDLRDLINQNEHCSQLSRSSQLFLKLQEKIKGSYGKINARFKSLKLRIQAQIEAKLNKQIKNQGKIDLDTSLNNLIKEIKSCRSIQYLNSMYSEFVQKIKGQNQAPNKQCNQKNKILGGLSLSSQQFQNRLKQLEIQYLRHKITLIQQSYCSRIESRQLQMNPRNLFSSTDQDFNLTLQSKLSLKNQGYITADIKQTDGINQNQNDQIPPGNGYSQCFNCERSFYVPYIVVPSARRLKINIVKGVIKEKPHEFISDSQFEVNNQQFQTKQQLQARINKKQYKLQFIIQVQLNKKKWFIRRKIKDFAQLENIIHIMFHNGEKDHLYDKINFSFQNSSRFKLTQQKKVGLDCDEIDIQLQSPLVKQHTNVYPMVEFLNLSSYRLQQNPKQYVQNVRCQLNQFLNQLNEVECVRNSRIFQKFVRINKEYLDL